MDITEKERIDDQGNKTKGGLSTEQFCIVYAVCHVMGMLSACANPVIYGYLNENFNREFKEIFLSISECVKWPCGSVSFRRKQQAAAAAAAAAATLDQPSPPAQEQQHSSQRQNGGTAATSAVFVNGGDGKVKVLACTNGPNNNDSVAAAAAGDIEMQPLKSTSVATKGHEEGRRRGPCEEEGEEEEQEALLQ